MEGIKCRGKSIISIEELDKIGTPHKNGWVYGTYIEGYIINGVIEATDECIVIENWTPVDIETVGLFAGEIDISGKEIYTKDIISNPGGYLEKVVFSNGSFRTESISFPYSCQYLLSAYLDRTLRIVGNTTDNPELLKGD